MLTTAVTITLSLLVVGALAFAYGMAVGRRRAEAAARDSQAWQQREVEQVRHELEATRRRRDELDARAAALDSELSNARDNLEAAHGELRHRVETAPASGAAPSESVALRERIQELELEHQRTTRLREVDRSRMEQLRSELQQQEEALAARDQRLIAAERETAAARAALEEMQATHGSAAAATRAADARSDRQRIAELEDDVATRSAAVARLGAELRSLEESYAEQLRERDEEATELRALTLAQQQQLQSMQGERVEGLDRLATAAAEASALRTEVAELREQIRGHRERDVQLLASHDEREAILESVRAAASEQDHRLQAAVSHRGQHIEELRRRLADSARALEEADARGRAQQEQTSVLQESLERDRKRLSVVADRAAALDREARASRELLDVERAERAAEVAGLASTLADIDARLAARENDLETLQEQLDVRTRTIETLEAEIDEERDARERRQREREQAITRLARALDIAREQASGAEQRRTLAEEQRDTMLARSEQHARDAAEAAADARRHAARSTELESDLRHAIAQLEAVRADLADQAAQATRAERELRDEVSQLRSELSGQRDAAAAAMQRWQRSDEALRAAEQIASGREARIAELSAEIDHLLDARERLMRDLHDREEQVRRIRLRLSTKDDPGA